MTTPHPEDMPEREAFEAWIRKDGGDLSTFGSGKHVHYNNTAVESAWEAWQARASLAEQRTRAMQEENELLRDALSNLIETYGTDSPMWWQARSALTSTPPSAPGKGEAEGNGLTLSAQQLKDALEFVAPDFDADEDQREAEVCIQELPARMSTDGEPMPAGLYCWLAEYPEEGCIPLLPAPPSHPGPLERMQKIDDEMGIEP